MVLANLGLDIREGRGSGVKHPLVPAVPPPPQIPSTPPPYRTPFRAVNKPSAIKRLGPDNLGGCGRTPTLMAKGGR